MIERALNQARRVEITWLEPPRFQRQCRHAIIPNRTRTINLRFGTVEPVPHCYILIPFSWVHGLLTLASPESMFS